MILAKLAIFLHSRQQISYQGTLKTQWWNLIGSRSRLGPLMDPTWTLKWTSTFSGLLQAVFTIYTLHTPAEPPSTKAQGNLLDLYGPSNGPQNGLCDAEFRGPLVKKGPAGSLHGPKWSIFLDRSQDNGQT